jgi:hypothetical protein
MLMSRFSSRCANFAWLAICLAGCGSDALPVAEVSGKVTFRGQPVTEGTISFHNSDGLGYGGGEATLGPDGSYRLETAAGGVTVGEYKVSVSPPMVINSSDPRTPPFKEYKQVANIPAKYHTPATTDLKATVKEGENTLDFDLK